MVQSVGSPLWDEEREVARGGSRGIRDGVGDLGGG
jgi:hypothetical protein